MASILTQFINVRVFYPVNVFIFAQPKNWLT